MLMMLNVYLSTKLRVDHAATRFQLPDTSSINTYNKWVPPIFVIQIQIPSDPPASMFSTQQDGPGWAIVMYYRITEVSKTRYTIFIVTAIINIDNLILQHINNSITPIRFCHLEKYIIIINVIVVRIFIFKSKETIAITNSFFRKAPLLVGFVLFSFVSF